MRFGSRSHDSDREDTGRNRKGTSERTQLVNLLRNLADRIEDAPIDRIGDSIAWLTDAAAPLVRVVERALESRRAKK